MGTTVISATYKVIQLDRGDALIDSGDDFLCDGCCIDVIWIETVTKTRYARCDLVELDAFFAAI